MIALMRSELMQRLRGKRWWFLIALWTLALFGVTLLVRIGAERAIVSNGGLPAQADPDYGATMFGALMLFTLVLVCLVIPSLTSTSVNSERAQGTFAVLQATLLRPHEILLAKLLSGLIVTVGFLSATIPLTIWSMFEGGVALGRVAVVYLILMVLAAVLLAVGLATSTFVRRPALSAVVSYGVVVALTLGTLIVFGFAMLSAPQVQRPLNDPGCVGCTTTEIRSGARWVILAPNPFVVLADAAPRAEGANMPDPLSGLRSLIRFSRTSTEEQFLADPGVAEAPPVWPAGLAIEMALALALSYVTIVKLRVPARRLAPGQRVA